VALDERSQLIHDDGVTARGEHVEQRLRAEELADRGRERRPADLCAYDEELRDRLIEPVARRLGSEVRVERSHEARRQVVLGGADRDARSERRHGLVADVLVHEVRRFPQRRDADVALEPQPLERLSEGLARHAMQRQRDWVHSARDQLRSGSGGFEGRGQRVAAGSLAVDAYREAARLAEADYELPRAMGLEGAGRIVEKHTRRAEVPQLAGLLHQRVVLARSARAVHEPGLELAAGRGHGVRRLSKIRDVVQRIVEAEHVDAVLGGGRDETPDEVVVHRARAHEEPATQRQAERRLYVRLQRPDPLPRAFDAAADGAVEAAAAGDL
jgi:hypothetical protein